MQVILLCGGLGTRLREETEFRPKPMVHIGDRPILWHIMKAYASYGLKDFVLALGYKGEMIKKYFYDYELAHAAVKIDLNAPKKLQVLERHDEADWQITMVETGADALKGARLKRLEKYITGDTFLMTYGDSVSNVDINALQAFHKKHGKLVTVTGINPTSRFGELKVNGDQVVSFTEKPENSDGIINGGFFVFNRKIFDYLEDRDECDFEKGPLEDIALAGELMVYKHQGFWSCMDTIRDMEYLNNLWMTGKAPWKVW